MGEAKRRRSLLLEGGFDWPDYVVSMPLALSALIAAEAQDRGKRATTPPFPLTDFIRQFCKRLSDSDPVILLYTDLEVDYRAVQCHSNVIHRVRSHGGARLNGWMIWQHARYVEAEFHSVWCPAQSQELVDITPRLDGELKVVFLPDRKRKITRGSRGDIVPANHTSIQACPYIALSRPIELPRFELVYDSATRAYMDWLGVESLADDA